MATYSRCLRSSAPTFRPHTISNSYHQPHQSIILPIPQCLHAKTYTTNGKTRRFYPKPKSQDQSPTPTQDEAGAAMDRGSLAPGSIFDSELYPKRETPSPPSPKREPRNPRTAHLRARRHIIGQAHRRSRISPVVSIRKKERECTSKSPMFKTSVKKLGPLARQIAGKPLGEAMVQMRFSKKKAARDVLKHLVLARSTAIVKRGMGLGKGKKGEEKLGAKERERVEEKGVGVGEKVPGGEVLDGQGEAKKAVVVRDKDGKRRTIEDLSNIYVDQAWVGRGKYGHSVDYRAMKKRNIMDNPSTSITVLLKEERTRLREAKDREEKRANKKVWVQLPDRPVTAQRQFMLW